ncbi:cyclin-like protein [Aaosphaeria arxii CBS 175.79]|uniref:Cyclin-like protein n=1 Tax=Aaosphaeria arxii CBS 175.79 TaxID=1450172 RepID=A0A6A5XIV2_9PLEO|nr:cyclin-like protein [Aaosphaeria arxii CBS 175.79]KAF2012700.1 cyclin-like protein [Aaosphaeria arxii CBS 175.79]
MQLTEDNIYRSSSQFRNWSFTPAKLAAQRQTTNIQASERVKAAFARQRAQRARQPDTASASESERGNGSGIDTGSNTPIPVTNPADVNCLTVAEEMKLVDSFCERTLELGKFLKFPIEVTATAIQFLRRFYLVNSPMTYEPQTISRSTMYLSTKVECHHRPAADYAAMLTKTTPESVIAPEYLIVQGLRFTFDVKHPFRGLKGGHLELMEMARGNAAPTPHNTQTPAELQKAMQALPKKAGEPPSHLSAADLEKRITHAYTLASDTLKSVALLTDAYFLYTPSQIWLAAHLLADEPLTAFYLSTKIPTSSPMYPKLLSRLNACAELLSSHRKFASQGTSEEEKKAREERDKKEVSALMKKLKQCRDPDKLDLVKLNQAQKRDALNADGQLEESKAKRRKMDRDALKKEEGDFWGPELPSRNGEKA